MISNKPYLQETHGNFFEQIELNLKIEKLSIGYRMILWGGSVLGLFFASDKSEKIPKPVVIGIAGIGLCHILYSVNKLGREILQTGKQQSFSLEEAPMHLTQPSDLDFRLPSQIGTMLIQDLEEINREQPIQYFNFAGGKVGISIDGERVQVAIDAGSLTPEKLRDRLKAIKNRYPHLSQIKVIHFKGNIGHLIGDLSSFHHLSHLSFENCFNLLGEDLEKISNKHGRFPNLKRIDLVGCNNVAEEIYKKMANKYAITFPDGSSNLNIFFKKFHLDLKKKIDDLLLQIVDNKIANIKSKLKAEEEIDSGLLSRFESLCDHLKISEPIDRSDLEQYKKKRKELIEQLEEDLDPTKLEFSLQNSIKWILEEEIKKIIKNPYIVVLGSKFTFEIEGMVLCDLWLESILQSFHFIDAYLRSLDVRNSCLTGDFLSIAKGLPIEKLIVKNLKNLNNEALRHLTGLSELKYLDLSESPVTGEGLIALMALSKLKILFLDRCTLITNHDLKVSITKLMFRGLELLSITGAPQIASEEIMGIIKTKSIDLTSPFLIASDRGGIRTVDLSATHCIDAQTTNYLKIIEENGDILKIAFGKGTRLNSDHLRNLFFLKKIQHFELQENEIDIEMFKLLLKTWPIRHVLLGDYQIEISGLHQKDILQAEKISISSLIEMSPLIWSFLGFFQSINFLEINSPNILKNTAKKLAAICSSQKIQTLSLTHPDITNNDLEDLSGAPNESIRSILSQCTHLKLNGTKVTNKLFNGWHWDINSGVCSIYVGNGSQKTYSNE